MGGWGLLACSVACLPDLHESSNPLRAKRQQQQQQEGPTRFLIEGSCLFCKQSFQEKQRPRRATLPPLPLSKGLCVFTLQSRPRERGDTLEALLPAPSFLSATMQGILFNTAQKASLKIEAPGRPSLPVAVWDNVYLQTLVPLCWCHYPYCSGAYCLRDIVPVFCLSRAPFCLTLLTISFLPFVLRFPLLSPALSLFPFSVGFVFCNCSRPIGKTMYPGVPLSLSPSIPYLFR